MRLETDRQDISVLHEAEIHVDHIWGETSLKFNVQVCFICLNKFYCKFPSAVTKWLMFMHTLLFPQINLDKNFGLSYPYPDIDTVCKRIVCRLSEILEKYELHKYTPRYYIS